MRRNSKLKTRLLLGLLAMLLAPTSACISPRGPVLQPLVAWSPMRHHSARFRADDNCGGLFGHFGNCWYRWPADWAPCPWHEVVEPPLEEINRPLETPPQPPQSGERLPDPPTPVPPTPGPLRLEPNDSGTELPPSDGDIPQSSRRQLWGQEDAGVVQAHYFRQPGPFAGPPGGEFRPVLYEQNIEGPPAGGNYPPMMPQNWGHHLTDGVAPSGPHR